MFGVVDVMEGTLLMNCQKQIERKLFALEMLILRRYAFLIHYNQIGTTYVNPITNVKVPIVSFKELKPPVVCCVALGRTNGVFESNLASMKWKSQKDYWFFN